MTRQSSGDIDRIGAAAMPPEELTVADERIGQHARYQHVWWNFGAIALDVAFWSAGIACVDMGAVLPYEVVTSP